MRKITCLALGVALAFAAGAQAQTPGSEVQRDVNQQQRIEQGLQSGQLNTREAAKLESGETKIDRMESNAMKDGTLSPTEKARIRRAQNAESGAIYREKHDAQTGNPSSLSSRRMQTDVQRNVNQQARIEQGVQSGALTNRETGSLERGQAHVARSEAHAGADGRVGAIEQASVHARENHQSHRIYRKKHDVAVK